VTRFVYDTDGRRVKRGTVTHTMVYVGSHYELQFRPGNKREDLDGNCVVNVVDIMLVVARWSCQSGDDCYDPLYDLDGNEVIDIADVMLVAAHWRETCERPAETVKYYTLGGKRVAMRREPEGQAATLYYLFRDHLGSTSVAYDTSNDTWTSQRYYAYGGTRSGGVPTDRLFADQLFDGTIELYQMGARWYEPALGRWIQPDTIVPNPANPQSLNRYSYVLNNPLRYTDPTGHAECVDEECNWVFHPVSGEIIRRRPGPTPPPPPEPTPFSPEILWGLLAYELGPRNARGEPIIEQVFDPFPGIPEYTDAEIRSEIYHLRLTVLNEVYGGWEGLEQSVAEACLTESCNNIVLNSDID
jgi:RHS repeat-associated protein